MLKGTYKFILVFALFLYASCGDNRMADSDQSSKAEKQNNARPKEDVVIEEVVKPPVVVDQPVPVPVEPGPAVVVPEPVPMPYPVPVFGGGGGGGRRIFCGNGNIERDEECDDGNREDNDLCSDDCKKQGLRLEKSVVNGEDGNAKPSAFDIIVTGEDGIHDDGVVYHSGDLLGTKDGVTYTISELSPPLIGYELTDISCSFDDEDDVDLGASFTAEEGRRVTCIVTNTFVPPTLTLIKDVATGSADPAEFTLVLSTGGIESDQFDGDVIELTAGTTYDLTEPVVPDGYELTSIACVDQDDEPVDLPFEAALGQDVTCTVINDLLTPALIATKVVLGTNLPVPLPDFNLVLTPDVGSPIITDLLVGEGVDIGLTVGVTYTISEQPVVGFETEIECTVNGEALVGLVYEAAEGDLVECEVTNTFVGTAILNLIKDVNLVGVDYSLFTLTYELNGEAAIEVTPDAVTGIVPSISITAGASVDVNETNIPAGFILAPTDGIICVDASAPLLPLVLPFDAEVGVTYNCTVTNVPDAL